MTDIVHGGSSTIATIPTIIQGLTFILTHVEDLWPKMMSTRLTYNAQIPVKSPEEAVRHFVQAKLLDCKISGYPNYTDDFRKGAHDSRVANIKCGQG